ncbi:MAG: Trk system potassium transporter TrkA [Bacillota bacterium]|nr:Trk system potassium transporter TrkA [Bacillota bacterium]
MKIVIIGGGKVGALLASELTNENHDVVIIDEDKEKVKLFSETMDVMTLHGNGALASVQREADVDESDLVIAVTAQDEMNILACIVARKLGCPNTIARVRNRGYAEQMYMLKDDLGLSMVINPELLAAKEFYGLLQMPAFMNRDSFAEGRAENVELAVDKDSVLNGLCLKDMSSKVNVKVLVCAVVRDGKVFIPDGNFVLSEGDKIYVTAPARMLAKLTHELKLRSRKSKNVLIVGGGKIAEFLAPMLLKSGTRVKIIESDRNRCSYLAEIMPDASIICSDGSSQAVLKMHNIEHMDAVLPLTNIDEENIIIAMFARRVGVPQVLTKINRMEYGEILGDRGADALVSSKELCSYEVVRFVRAMENTGGSAVLTIYKLADGKAEAQEFAVTDATKNLGVPLMNLKLKPGILIACISHKGKIIIPGGSDMLSSGDTVVVVTTAGRAIIDLNDIFA